MKMLKFIAVLLLSFLSSQNLYAQITAHTITFWDQPQKGTNIFNQHVSREDIKAAKAYGIDFIRLAPTKFPTTKRDFLIGDAGNYVQLVPEDLKTLQAILDVCAEENMPVVLTVLSLPGSRWKQQNNDQLDLRLWTEPTYQKQAAQFWKDLASELKDHPAVIGYNILNEPRTERIYGIPKTNLYDIKQEETQQILFDFHQKMIDSIRTVDKITPIILDSSASADPQTFKFLKTQSDPYVLYSFHMYEPFEYTNRKENMGRFTYPGKINDKYYDKKALENYLDVVIAFQKKHHIPSNRILVGEFGGHRTSAGLPQYFADLVSIFEKNHWHTAFYAFREDTWDGMDYELGDKPLPWSYWKALEKGEQPILNRNANSPAFKILKDSL